MAKLLAKALRTGETIGLIAPASPPRSESHIERAVSYLERQGYRVELGKHVLDGLQSNELGYLAATDANRVADLHDMFTNHDVKAIIALRGGYGTIRLLDKINYELLRQFPKILVGYSDLTALLHAIHLKAGIKSCFFGPMASVDMIADFDAFAEECFWRAMTVPAPLGSLPLAPGEATVDVAGPEDGIIGKLLPGNLTVLTSLVGTPYFPRMKSPIPLLEEIDEKPRRIDANLAQLRLAGFWRGAAAVLRGYFSGCEDHDAASMTVEQVFEDGFSGEALPTISGLPFGHEPRMWTVPVGARTRIRFEARPRIEILEVVVQ